VDSYGVVEPRTQTNLFAQVSGQVIEVTDAFREGEFFEKNDVLLRIDDRDYQTLLTVSESDLQVAKQNLEEEEARVVQAIGDWKRSGKITPAPELALRKPQLAAARAQLSAALAKKNQAKRNLERTSIVAPYAGRVRSKQVDIGQLISPSALLGVIYAVDFVEIRLPIKNNALKYIQLPENFRHKTKTGINPLVEFYSDLGEGRQTWQGKIVRTEGAIDKNTNQLYVIAQIDDPYSLSRHSVSNNEVPIKIGQYLEAAIEGKKIEQAIVIPTRTLYQGNFVYLYKDGLIQKQQVEIAWRNSEQLLISSGLKTGDQLVLTTLGQITSGTAVTLKSELNKLKKKRKPRKKTQ
jgi:RND family efflux transporter MFP subunit